MIRRCSLLLLSAFFAAVCVGCSHDSYSSTESSMKPAAKADIVDTAVAASDFTTLVTAVKVAGLVDTLKGPGPFTVFAPTDAAFAKLPDGALQSLLDNPDQLKAVLLHHVVPGRVMASQVTQIKSAQTAGGGQLAISTANGVTVDGAKVVKTDIVCSNGVIHVIDSVMLP